MIFKIRDFYIDFKDEKIKEINILYFESLYNQYVENHQRNVVLYDGENNSNIIPLPLATKEQLSYIVIQDYEALSDVVSNKLQSFNLCICKMQAGLGTSVKRDDLVKKYTKRTSLGSKGTDLFVSYQGKMISLAEVQLLLAEKLNKQNVFKSVSYLNLLNSETEKAVLDIWNNAHIDTGKSYDETFSTGGLSRKVELNQLMMPTIAAESNEITFERVAPAGHGFLGFQILLDIFKSEKIEDELITIGNGEDIQSNPDTKILSWIADNNIPITMITTTKLKKDKKGGQIAIVDEGKPYVSIIEKAQAEKSNQLEFFEEVGLREGDNKSLFNTNIVVINKKALKDKLNTLKNLTEEEFIKVISPDLIKNVKKQNGQEFIQLEGAIGSTILNLDMYFRKNAGQGVIGFLNLAPENRERFFKPIKTREEFDGIYSDSTPIN